MSTYRDHWKSVLDSMHHGGRYFQSDRGEHAPAMHQAKEQALASKLPKNIQRSRAVVVDGKLLDPDNKRRARGAELRAQVMNPGGGSPGGESWSAPPPAPGPWTPGPPPSRPPPPAPRDASTGRFVVHPRQDDSEPMDTHATAPPNPGELLLPFEDTSGSRKKPTQRKRPARPKAKALPPPVEEAAERQDVRHRKVVGDHDHDPDAARKVQDNQKATDEADASSSESSSGSESKPRKDKRKAKKDASKPTRGVRKDKTKKKPASTIPALVPIDQAGSQALVPYVPKALVPAVQQSEQALVPSKRQHTSGGPEVPEPREVDQRFHLSHAKPEAKQAAVRAVEAYFLNHSMKSALTGRGLTELTGRLDFNRADGMTSAQLVSLRRELERTSAPAHLNGTSKDAVDRRLAKFAKRVSEEIIRRRTLAIAN